MKNKYRFSFPVFLAAALLFFSNNCAAQMEYDDKPVNLKVLPKNISDKELHKIMDSFTYALGVHCNYCHGDSKEESTKRTDFAADKNPNKQISRVMMKMVDGINNNLLSDARVINSDVGKVECVTCHRGSSNIDKLEDVLFESYHKDGLDTAINTYSNLKQKYYGSFTYDFRDHALLSFASKILEAGKTDDAIKVVTKDIELFPESTSAYAFLGNIYMKNGNNELAIKNFEKALLLDPENRFAKGMLRKLKDSEKK